jgi:hypothetical protein
MNLKRLMYAGYYGGSVIKGEPPKIVIDALAEKFDVVNVYVSCALSRELRCYEPEGRMRMKIRYGWMGTGWVYEPVAVRRNRPVTRQPGDVIYNRDGSWRVAA